jgi:hypothetical protein
MRRLLLAGLVLAAPLWAQHDKKELTVEYLNSAEALREDEFAESLARRDWLKDRLILSGGLGSKYGSWGEASATGGLALEYVSRWPSGEFGRLGGFASYGMLRKADDEADTKDFGGGSMMRGGVTFTFLPKLALHPGISLSYGTAHYDYIYSPNASDPDRAAIFTKGYTIEGTFSYIADDWWYFNLGVGASYSGKAHLAADKQPYGLKNESITVEDGKVGSIAVFNREATGIPAWNYPTISFGVGIAVPDLFPDVTEKRFRQRKAARRTLDQ